MKNCPWAKLTIVSSPKINEMPSATSTKIEPRARPVKSCRRKRSRVIATAFIVSWPGLSPAILKAEVARLFDGVELVAAEVDDHQDIGPCRLDAREEGREIGGAKGMPDVGGVLDVHLLGDAPEAAQHL